MKIECLTTFLDGPARFEQGDIRTVDDADGARFVAHGWAKAVGGDADAVTAPADVTLAIDNSTIGHASVGLGGK